MLLIGKTRRTYYEILSVAEDASYDEMRASYKAALLNSHPDKALSRRQDYKAQHDLPQDFLDVQKAWEVLSDSKSREDYDKELRKFREAFEVVAYEIELSDMTMETLDGIQELCYQCRCGDFFSISLLELRELGVSVDENEEVVVDTFSNSATSVILPCGSCSLKLRLVVN